MLLGIVAVAAVPGAIELTRTVPGVDLLNAAYAVPIALAAGIGALLFARGAHGTLALTLERSGGNRRIRLGRGLAVAGICIGLSAAIAVGFYELLLLLEN